jgi:FHA domain-containing protein/double zinc ribbon protein
MPFCPQCGVDNPAAARFCDQCGAVLIPVAAAPPSAAATAAIPAPPSAAVPPAFGAAPPLVSGPITCSQCGAAAIPGEAFCDNCGAPLNAPARSAAPAPVPSYNAGVPPQPAYPAPQPANLGPPPSQPVSAPPPWPASPPPIATTVPQPAVQPSPPPSAMPASARTVLAPAQLIVAASGAALPLPSGPQAVVGRSDPVSNFYPDIDLSPYGALDNGVGRRHLRLFVQNGQALIEDLDSTNGTTLNGQKLAPRQPQPLRDGDQILVGKLLLRFQS